MDKSPNTQLIAIGAGLMAIAVILGALGAHALEQTLTIDQLDSFKTGVRYQAWHSITLILLGAVGPTFLTRKSLKILATLFILGIVFFSFSIYLLSTRDLLGTDSWVGILGPITPIGGLLLILGWLLLAVNALRFKKSEQNR
jgi:uncharacterized membrane protein YgdD (TMEM256/DUF423 family)